MKDFITYSPAMLKTFKHCQKKFEYKYIMELNIPIDNSKIQQGKNIHALASYYLRKYNIEKLENALNKNEKILWNNLKNNNYFNFETIQSEYNITSKISEYRINGRLDALVRQGEKYYILDYKTGSIPKNAEQDYQTIIYLIIADKLIQKYESLNFVYIDLKNNTNKIIPFDNNIKKEYEIILKEEIQNIEKCIKHNIYKKNSQCKMCEYDKICNNQA